MKKITYTAAILAGMAAASTPWAFADEPSVSVESSKSLQKAAAAVVRSVGINTTWAETGVSATGIASSDFLHNDITKPANKPLIGESSEPANVPAVVSADEMPATVAEAPMGEAPEPEVADAAPAADTPSPAAAPPSSASRPRSSAPAPARSYGGGKNVVSSSAKDVYVDPIIADSAPLFELSVDGGYQSRYYLLGVNRVLSGGFVLSPEESRFVDQSRLTQPDDTAVYYAGVSANYNGLGVGVNYVRGVSDIETRFSRGDNIVRTEYEELVANINYTLAVLPDGWLNVTGGYRAIFFDEETFYNTGRFDDFYVTISNAVIPYLRPSLTYHYLDQGSALGVNDNTILPGAKIHDGQLLIVQIDGQLGVPEKTGLPFDVVYYAQVGFDDELNVDFGPDDPRTNDFDHNWTQVGVTIPIFVGPLTISPNWNYNESAEDLFVGQSEHFWGVNVRFDF